MNFRSIRWRLQIWYGLILVVLLAAFGFTAWQLERGRQFRRVDEELRRRANMLGNALAPGRPGRPPAEFQDERPLPDQARPLRPGRMRPGEAFEGTGPGEASPIPEGFRLPPRLAELIDETNPDGFYYVLLTFDGKELLRSANAPAGVPVEPVIISRPPRGRLDSPAPGNLPLRPGPPGPPPPPQMHGVFRDLPMITPSRHVVLVGRSVAPELADLRRVALLLTGIGGIILLLGLAGGWWLAGRAIRPIEDISATAVKISAGDLSQRINVADTENELGRLAGVLNSAFARLEAAFAQQQQFTSDAAHELRTPVSVMLTQTQAALQRERDAAGYREAVEACERAAQRMRRLIESLLELARLDAGQETMNRAPLDLARIAADGVELIRPLAAGRGITIRSELAGAECQGDAERLGQVVTNLLANAISYNKDGGEVRVVTRREAGFVVLSVADTGTGIAPEHLAHVFERFYRADPSRSAAQGRAGLGLAICRAVVEAHGGSIEVASETGAGATFTARLPAG